MSPEAKVMTREVIKAFINDAADIAKQFVDMESIQSMNPATAAMAFRIAAEYSEYQLRLKAGEDVFDAYVVMRDGVVSESAKQTTEIMLGKHGVRS